MNEITPAFADWYPDTATGGTNYWDRKRWTGDARPRRRPFAAPATHRQEGISVAHRHQNREDVSMARRRRPGVLDNRDWLIEQYETRSAAQIGRDLGVNPQMVLAALRRHDIAVRTRVESLRLRSPLLHDPEALQQQVEATSVPAVAATLGVTIEAVHAAMSRSGVQSVHRYNGPTSLPRPDEPTLHRWWESEQTVKGVALRAGVSPTTASVWLARVGIFVNETPAISRPDLCNAIKTGDSVEVIRRRHRVTGSTVIIELHRHGLFTAHRRRHVR